MKTRIIAGVTAATLVTLLVFRGPGWMLTAAALGCALLSYVEFAKLFFPNRAASRQLRMVPFIGAAMLCIEQSLLLAWVFLWLPFAVLGIPEVRLANRTGDFQAGVREVALDLLGFVYVVSLLGFLKPIAAFEPHGRQYLYLLFMVVFGGDTFAYFAGVRWGKHRLVRQLSPKKSWEGAVGAVVGALFFAWLWVHFLYDGPKTTEYYLKLFLFVPVWSALAQFGDLFESLLKRAQHQKDSGSFLPGHGGILDRIDGLAFAAPIFYLYLLLVLEKV